MKINRRRDFQNLKKEGKKLFKNLVKLILYKIINKKDCNFIYYNKKNENEQKNIFLEYVRIMICQKKRWKVFK